jgi:HD-GYP domain-containing protein (c-di-GMP phosphodiesterase class II)
VFACGEKCGDDPQVSSYEMQLLEAAGGYTGAMLENATLYRAQQAMFLGTLRSLTAAIDAKDRYTCGHSERVALMAAKLAEAAGLSAAQAERVHICGLVHDVGKIGVPEAVLCKPGRLTNEEFAIIKQHPDIGHRILKDIPMLEDVLPGVLHHHERWDGKGYPQSLKGEDVPLFARLIALADTFDAMSSTRSYRAAMPRAQVLAEIERSAGTQFDPGLAARFVRLDFSEFDRMVQRHALEQGIPLAAAA